MWGEGGVKDAAVDIVNMELMVTTDGKKIDARKLLETIRTSCAHPKPPR